MADVDFIIVGAGPAGCVLATQLASDTDCAVLLIEAGGPNDDIANQVHGQRWTTLMSASDYNWQHKSIPQAQLDGRILGCDAGKGLGGGTAVNFSCYTYGASADYDRWAADVGDDAWKWEKCQSRFADVRSVPTRMMMLETYHQPLEQFHKYVKPVKNHGQKGPLDISFEEKWEKGFEEFVDAFHHSGHPTTLDSNSGNPIGVTLVATSSYKSRRVTAATALLSPTPSNLKVKTDTLVTRVLFDGSKAIGVDTAVGSIFARKEVIICAGAIQTPKLLLLSGIGPKADLELHRIPVVADVAGIGRNLKDHTFSFLMVAQKPGTNDRAEFFGDPDLMGKAYEQWIETRDGPLSIYYSSQALAYLKLENVFNSKEFLNLPEDEQAFLKQASVPSYEVLSHIPPFSHAIGPLDTYLGLCIAQMNPQSRGSVKLQSTHSSDPPLIDTRSFEHPFDRRVAIESIRAALQLFEIPAIKEHIIGAISRPAGDSDEEIWDYIKSTAMSMWHHCGTVKMGKLGAEDTCVDSAFRVIGTEGLRVVDMSVAPLLPNCHTSATAYLVGATAAEKFLAQYSSR